MEPAELWMARGDWNIESAAWRAAGWLETVDLRAKLGHLRRRRGVVRRFLRGLLHSWWETSSHETLNVAEVWRVDKLHWPRRRT